MVRIVQINRSISAIGGKNMKKRKSWKHHGIALLVVYMVALAGYGCDPGGGICSEAVTVRDTAGARLYYPCNIANNTEPVGATTLTSGYLGTYSQVEWLAEEVAAAGYVVLAATPSNPYGMVSGWRDAHKSCVARLKDLNSTHSTLRGKIDTNKLQTCGHSKGGGGSLWASSQLQGELKSTIGMAPWQEEFTSWTLRSIASPTFIQAGATDTLATGSMTKGEYDALPNIPKAYIRYSMTDHMAWASGGTNQDRLARDVIAWMKYYLDGDPSQQSYIADTSRTTLHIWER